MASTSPMLRGVGPLDRNTSLSRFVLSIPVTSGNCRHSPGLNLVKSLNWALDGSFVLRGYDANGHSGLFRVDAQTGRMTVLVNEEDGEQLRWIAGISADGKRLYYGKLIYRLLDTRPVQEPVV